MSDLKLHARFPLGTDCYGKPRYADVWTSGGVSPGAEGLDEMKLWLDTIGRPMAEWNERQAHRAVCFALEGLCRGLTVSVEGN